MKFFPNLIAQINILMDHDTSNSPIVPSESPVDHSESPVVHSESHILDTSYYIDDCTQPSISIEDPPSHFPDFEWFTK